MLDFKSYMNLQEKYLVIKRHMLQIQVLLLQHLNLNWPICPLQVFYLTFKMLQIIAWRFITYQALLHETCICLSGIYCQALKNSWTFPLNKFFQTKIWGKEIKFFWTLYIIIQKKIVNHGGSYTPDLALDKTNLLICLTGDGKERGIYFPKIGYFCPPPLFSKIIFFPPST